MKKRMLSVIIAAMMTLQVPLPVAAELDVTSNLPIEEEVVEDNTIAEDDSLYDEPSPIEAEAESVFDEDMEYAEETYFDEEEIFYDDSTMIEEEPLVEEQQIPEVEELDSLPEEFITDELITEELITEDLAISEEDGEIVEDELTLAGATSGKCGDKAYWTLNNGVLTISGTGDMYDYSHNSGFGSSAPWYSRYKEISRIIIKSGIARIGNCAFYQCFSLTGVTIPDSVTCIGEEAFYNCITLTSVTIPGSVTNIGKAAFSHCDALSSATIGNGVIEIGGWAFGDCLSLKSVTIPDSVKSIGECAFRYCDSLTGVTIGKGVTSIGKRAFWGYYNHLTEFSVHVNNSAYSSVDGVLFDKNKSTLISFPGGKSGAYVIPDGVVRISDSAFEHRTSVTSLTIPDSVTSIGVSAFWDCSALSDVYYDGSEEDWKAITIETGNDSLSNATIHYNDTNPTIPSVIIEDWNDWLRVNNSLLGYLTKPKNFPHNIYITANDDGWIGRFSYYFTNFVDIGSGWKELLRWRAFPFVTHWLM